MLKIYSCEKIFVVIIIYIETGSLCSQYYLAENINRYTLKRKNKLKYKAQHTVCSKIKIPYSLKTNFLRLVICLKPIWQKTIFNDEFNLNLVST